MSASNVLTDDEMQTLLSEDGRHNRDPMHSYNDGLPFNFYDFISEYHKSITKSRNFQAINKAFAIELKEQLFRLLRKKITVDIIEPEATTYEQYLDHNKDSSTLNAFKITPGNAFMLILINKPLLFSTLETLFGGIPNEKMAIEHHFSAVAMKLSQVMALKINDAIKQSFGAALSCDFDFLQTNHDQVLPNRLNPSDKIIVLQYRITFNSLSLPLDICIPHNILNAANQFSSTDDMNSLSEQEQQQWREALKHNIDHANINLSAEITETDISLRDVINLKVGDVISIDNPSVGYLLAEGVKVFKVKCGVHDGTKVVEIMERITD